MTGGRTEPLVLDTDILSELCRGNAAITARAEHYLRSHGRLTITAVTVFERLRRYRLAIRQGKPYERQLQAFDASSINLSGSPLRFGCGGPGCDYLGPLEQVTKIQDWRRLDCGDCLFPTDPLVTRNRKDYEPMTKIAGVKLQIRSWTRAGKRK